ncbi:MAG: GntR family transcriptional regulator [Bacteroides sp.]|nr:GntR family transcriptional regulator [Bacteroides sp.]MCM1413687.1 GntR family transcriptional regulator [Bacteroides sp.]MCM1471866.1 GntR family transcriptional regulator [Bacteroides sp.]
MEFNNNKPIYRQIIDYCFAAILSGRWIPEQRLPSVREMALDMAVNTHTVLKAYDFLQSSGIIYTRRGLGYFLAADAPAKVNEARRSEFFDETLPALFAEMQMLGITLDDIIARAPKQPPNPSFQAL